MKKKVFLDYDELYPNYILSEERTSANEREVEVAEVFWDRYRDACEEYYAVQGKLKKLWEGEEER